MSKAVTAADVMTNSVLTLSPQTPLFDALRLFVEEGIHGAPVVEDHERLVGVLTTTDLLRAEEEEPDTVSGEYLRELVELSGPDWMGDLTDFQDRLAQRTVRDAMTEGIVTVQPDAPVSEVARHLREHCIQRVFVEDDGRICGVVSTFDLLPVLEAPAARRAGHAGRDGARAAGTERSRWTFPPTTAQKRSSFTVGIPDILLEGWDAYGDPRRLADVEELSVGVSQNRVYRLHLEVGPGVVAKVSSYGSFVHFRQDHERIYRWIRLLHATRFDGVLADVLCRNSGPFLHRSGASWLVFYEEIEGGEQLPGVLEEDTIEALAREVACFHRTCSEIRPPLAPTWKTLGSDVAQLRDALEHAAWCESREIGPASAGFLRDHCDAFLLNADVTGFHALPKLPVLVDWNLGNFTVSTGPEGLLLRSRWDYDWFRIEPRILDFYFLARIVSSVGDRTDFTYSPEPLLEPRFLAFLRAYDEVCPLDPAELALVPETYRFFLLNYAIRDAEHFFRPGLCEQLRRDAIERHLPALSEMDFAPLVGFRDSG